MQATMFSGGHPESSTPRPAKHLYPSGRSAPEHSAQSSTKQHLTQLRESFPSERSKSRMPNCWKLCDERCLFTEDSRSGSYKTLPTYLRHQLIEGALGAYVPHTG